MVTQHTQIIGTQMKAVLKRKVHSTKYLYKEAGKIPQ